MSTDDYLKDYYKTLEESPLDVLEEAEGNTIAAIEDFKVAKDEKAATDAEKDLQEIRELIKRKSNKD